MTSRQWLEHQWELSKCCENCINHAQCWDEQGFTPAVDLCHEVDVNNLRRTPWTLWSQGEYDEDQIMIGVLLDLWDLTDGLESEAQYHEDPQETDCQDLADGYRDSSERIKMVINGWVGDRAS